MKLISWNVNGLRAVYRKDNLKDVFALDPDILLLQEIKAEREQLPPEVQNVPGYKAFFNSSIRKKGYSGVALYTKIAPKTVKYGLDIEHLDQEGRMVEAHFDRFTIINTYFPNGGGGPERLAFKLDFYDAFLAHIEKLRKKQPNIIFCGDINTAHEPIDLARPKENEKNTGFLPEERAWLDEVIASGYVDVYRHFNPEKENTYTYWDMQTRARERNVGWRIDYFFATQSMMPKVINARIHSAIYGSDHCPVSIEIS